MTTLAKVWHWLGAFDIELRKDEADVVEDLDPSSLERLLSISSSYVIPLMLCKLATLSKLFFLRNALLLPRKNIERSFDAFDLLILSTAPLWGVELIIGTWGASVGNEDSVIRTLCCLLSLDTVNTRVGIFLRFFLRLLKHGILKMDRITGIEQDKKEWHLTGLSYRNLRVLKCTCLSCCPVRWHGNSLAQKSQRSQICVYHLRRFAKRARAQNKCYTAKKVCFVHC